jgi:hypothetical protein
MSLQQIITHNNILKFFCNRSHMPDVSGDRKGDQWKMRQPGYGNPIPEIRYEGLSTTPIWYKTKDINSMATAMKRYNFIKKAVATLFVLFMTLFAFAQKPGTFKNPVIPGFNPDPAICRVGNDYYVTYTQMKYDPEQHITNWLVTASSPAGPWSVPICITDNPLWRIRKLKHTVNKVTSLRDFILR